MTATATRTWEVVVGLEVHCELATASKLFCDCRNEFGDEPNTNVCPVCLGLPGSLPVLNERAVEYALRVAEALHLRVVHHTRYREVLPDDTLTVGIHISNGEVGRRSVRVDAVVYRLVCTNGLIRFGAWQKPHASAPSAHQRD